MQVFNNKNRNRDLFEIFVINEERKFKEVIKKHLTSIEF